MHLNPNPTNTETTQTLQPQGLLDSVQGARLRQDLEALVQTGVKTVVLDCSDMTLIDSSGLGALVMCLKSLRAVDGNLCLSHLNQPMQLLLELTGLDDVLAVV